MKRTAIQKYDRLKTLSLEEGFALMRTEGPTKVMIDGALVSVRSTRLLTFLTHGVKCSYDGCKYVGSFFAIERSYSDAGKDPVKKSYHINLWGICQEDGREVLFTHDHVRARSHGGGDDMANTRTMCCWHNWSKSREEGKYLQKLMKMAGVASNTSDGLTKRQRRRLKRAQRTPEEIAILREQRKEKKELAMVATS
jgi:hypothetical protein